MSAQLRRQEHIKGQAMMKAENYFSALDIFLKAWKRYGPHVGLLSDIAASYYMLGRIEDYHHMLERLEKELHESLELLAPESAARTFLFLGKLVEEQGQVMKALEFYQEARDLCAQNSIEIRVQSQVQILRLQSFLGHREGLAELYQICLKLPAESQALRVELAHGLILAETVLFGLDAGVFRAQRFLLDNKVLPFDRRLMVIDLIDEALRQRVQNEILSKLLVQTEINASDLFESMMVQLYREPAHQLTIHEINQLVAQVPWMGALRILSIVLARETNPKARTEIERRFQFMLEPIEAASKSRLSQKFLAGVQSSQTLAYSIEKRILRMEDRDLLLKEGSLASLCFEALSRGSSMSLEDLSLMLGLDPGVDVYDRLRMAVWRLNKELQLFTGKNKTFHFAKAGISLAAGFRLSNF